jgi:hypothetical protein
MLVTGVVLLTAASFIGSALKIGTMTDLWPRVWLTVGDVILVVSLVAALVWSTGLARAFRLGWLRTGVFALAFGGILLLAAGLLADATFWPLWRVLPLPSVDHGGVDFQRDLPWLVNKAALCLLLSLPFAIWRAVQNRPSGPAQALQ